MEKSVFCLMFICIGLAASNSQDDTSQRSDDDNDKQTAMLFRLSQDMGAMMIDIKTLKLDMVDKMEQQRDIIDKMEQQQSDMMDEVKQQQHEMMDKMWQQQSDMMDKMEQLQSDINGKVEQQQREMMDKMGQQQSDMMDKMEQQQSDMMDKMEEQNRGINVIKTLVKVPHDGLGWVVILRRVDSEHNFDTNGWEAYKQGFGSPPSGSFWLGLETIHRFTTYGDAKLRIETEDFEGITKWAEYSHMRVLGESTGYKLTVSGNTGNATEVLLNDSGAMFTTTDRDNDSNDDDNCAQERGGPWWYYDGCSQAIPTLKYVEGEGTYFSGYKKKIEMMIRLK